jgi:hypothetical protein
VQSPQIPYIGSPEDRAWERLRLAIIARLERITPETERAVAVAAAAFIEACGE